MIQKMLTKNKLKDKVSNFKWPEIVFQAESEKQTFEHLTIVTLKSEYQENVYDLAWNQISSINELDVKAKMIMDSGNVTIDEYVKVSPDGHIKVCIDRDEINDDTVEEILDLLTEIEITPNMYHCISEGNTFSSEFIFG